MFVKFQPYAGKQTKKLRRLHKTVIPMLLISNITEIIFLAQ